jgi:hypothetical protein
MRVGGRVWGCGREVARYGPCSEELILTVHIAHSHRSPVACRLYRQERELCDTSAWLVDPASISYIGRNRNTGSFSSRISRLSSRFSLMVSISISHTVSSSSFSLMVSISSSHTVSISISSHTVSISSSHTVSISSRFNLLVTFPINTLFVLHNAFP